MFGKSNTIFRKFCLFSAFYFDVFELFSDKIKKKNNFFTKKLCFIYFLCIGIDLVPQKTLIQKVQFKLWKNNPGPQADTASY